PPHTAIILPYTTLFRSQTLTANMNDAFKNGQGPLPALLNDPEGKKKVYELVDNLRTTSTNLATFSESFKSGQGLLPRLINDKARSEEHTSELQSPDHLV